MLAAVGPDGWTHRTRANPLRVAVIVACLGSFLVQLDGSVLNVAMVQIGYSLQAPVAVLPWIIDAYAVVYACLLLSAGVVADRIGSERVFVCGFAVFTAASLLCAMAPGVGFLIAARAMQGVGGAILIPSSLALVNRVSGSDAAKRARAIALWTAAGGVAVTMGPILSGFFVSSFGWRSIFLINLPAGLIGIWMVVRLLPPSELPAQRRGFDWFGQIAAALTLLGLIYAVIEAGSEGWHAPSVLTGMVLAILGGIAFVRAESRSETPMVPLEITRNAAVSSGLFAGAVLSFASYGLVFGLGLYFQNALHYSPQETGWAFVPFALMVTLANIIGGRIAARIGPAVTVVTGLLIGLLGYVLLHGIGPGTTYLQILPAQLVARLGIGMAIPPMTTVVLSGVPQSRSGIVSGLLSMVRQAGGAIGVATFGSLIAMDPDHGFQTAVIVSAVLLIAAILAVVTARLRKP